MPAQSLRALNDDLKKKNKDNGVDEDVGTTKGSGWSVAPELIEEEEDFNTRGAFLNKKEYFAQEKVKAHIRKLADAYKRGDYVPPLIVKVVDDRILVRDGHCRRRLRRGRRRQLALRPLDDAGRHRRRLHRRARGAAHSGAVAALGHRGDRTGNDGDIFCPPVRASGLI